MAQTKCGFNDGPQVSGSDLLALIGPTLKVNIGFDATYKASGNKLPVSGIQGVEGLVDTGAQTSCIDNLLATQLGLPIVDRQTIAGSNGAHTANIYQAQVHVPTLHYTIWGTFAGVDLIAGGQRHHALIGRTFLKEFKMVYEGKTGTVTISST
jgi:predicted aspartyl protease